MSHFSVLVVTNAPGHEALAKALQPYHEFESTGIDDEYVHTLDITARLREEYATDTTRRFRAPDGTLYSPYDDQFYREPTSEEKPHLGMGTGSGHGLSWDSRDWGDGRGYRAKVHYCPDGWQEVDMPIAEVMTFRAFCEDWQRIPMVQHGEVPDLTHTHKYGYGLVDAQGEVLRVYDRTNPKKQWDWWQLGGRYTGRLISRRPGRTGEPGLHTRPADTDTCDQCRVGDLDLPAMQARARIDRQLSWQEARACDARTRVGLYDISPETTEEAYCTVPALQTFAILDHEGWFERGTMGWWGVVHDEREDWPQRYAQYLEVLMQHPERYIAIVDCHI